MTDDRELLREYAKTASEPAFAKLVSRHLPLVYSAALRQVGGNPEMAKDIAQMVFIDLARKAGSLCRHKVLTAWLYTSTRFAAGNLRRSENRRQAREQVAAAMQSLDQASPSSLDWDKIAPVLDEVMHELSANDRLAVLLRFFECKELKQIGIALGMSEDAARMRVTRALTKLHALLTNRGVVISGVALATGLSSQAVRATPANLVATITAYALASVAGGGGAILNFFAHPGSMRWKLALIPAAACIMALLMTVYVQRRFEATSQKAKSELSVSPAEASDSRASAEGEDLATARPTTARTAKASEYELEGETKAIEHLAFGNFKNFDPVRFHLYVKGCSWLIRASLQEDAGEYGTTISYWEFSFDGTYQYRFCAYKDPAEFGTDPWLGSVDSESVPTFGMMPHIPVVWFALASSCYLQSAGDFLTPAFSRDFTVVPLRAIVTRQESEPRLPQYAAFLSDGFGRRQPEPQKFEPPYDKGFTNAVFRTLEFTNVNGFKLPLAFELKTFHPGDRGLEVGLEASAVVDEVREGCSLRSFRPEIPYGTEGMIKDYRFVTPGAKSKHEFAYHSDQWLSVDEVKGLPKFKWYKAWEPTISDVPAITAIDLSGPAASAQGK